MPALAPLSGPPATPHPGPLPQGERETAAPLSCPPVSLCHVRRSPLSFPPVPSVLPAGPLCPSRRPPLCHSRRLLAGIQCLSLLSLHSCDPAESHGFPITNVGNDRRGLNAWGMTACLPWPLCQAPRQPLTPALSRKGKGRRRRPCHVRRSPFVMSAGPLCPSRRSPLSFPPVPSVLPAGPPSVIPAGC